MKPMTEGMRLALVAAIAASDDARQCTARLAGKTIAVETLDQRWLIRFEAGKAQVEHAGQAARPQEAAEEADATVRGSLAAVIEAFDSSSPHQKPAASWRSMSQSCARPIAAPSRSSEIMISARG